MYTLWLVGFVVPCQPGGSVLLQPRWHDLARMLPAFQKIAEREAEKEGERRMRGKILSEREKVGRQRGCEVLYHGGKCMSLPVLTGLLPMNDMAYWNG